MLFPTTLTTLSFASLAFSAALPQARPHHEPVLSAAVPHVISVPSGTHTHNPTATHIHTGTHSTAHPSWTATHGPIHTEPPPHPIALDRRGGKAKNIKYCSKPGVCSTVPADSWCNTLDKGYSLFTLDKGVTCEVFAEPNCEKQAFVREGGRRDVTGSIDLTKDWWAQHNGVNWAQSLQCY